MLDRVLSGGQTGADQAGGRAAKALKLATGGWMPQDFLTEAGPAFWLTDYGLAECPEPGYPARRRRNVLAAETMLLMGDQTTPGSRGLLSDWSRIRMGAAWGWVEPGVDTPRGIACFIRGVRLAGRPVASVLISGNRESLAPGIGARAERFMLAVFSRLADG